jgi:hypothetical protein
MSARAAARSFRSSISSETVINFHLITPGIKGVVTSAAVQTALAVVQSR